MKLERKEKDKTFSFFFPKTMVRFHLAGNPVSCSEFLADELRILAAGTEGSTIEIERLKLFTKVCHRAFTL